MYYLICIEGQGSAHAATICSSGDTKEEIWHRRFSYLGTKNLQKLAREQLVTGLDYDVTKDNFCEQCVDGKHHRSSFPKPGERRATQQLEIVHKDVCGKIKSKSLVEPNTSSHLLMTNQNLYAYTYLKTREKYSRSSWSGKPWRRIQRSEN